MRRSSIPVLVASLWLSASSAGMAGEEVPAPTAEPRAEAVIADLPFEATDEPSRIYLDLAPEGNRPLVVMLDTGATFSVFTPLAARAAGVSVRRTKNSPYRRKTRLGRDLQFYVDTSSSDTGSKTGFEYGLLGGNFLEEYVLEIDFESRRVRFIDPKQYQVPESVAGTEEAVVPLQIRSSRVFPEIEMNGKPMAVLMDTGAHAPLIVSGQAAKKLGVDVKALPPFGELGTTRGPMTIHLHETDSFRIGPFDFDLMPVLVAPRGWYNIGGNTDSVIGYDTLQQFLVRIDYPRSRLWLRRQDSRVTFMGVDYATTRAAGAFLYPAGESYQVVGVTPDSPAEQIGLRPGDHLARAAEESPQTVAETMERIVRGESILVARRTAEDVWVEVALPTGERSGSVAAGADDSPPAQ